MLVYLLTDPRTPKKGYVGQTRFSAARRLGDHLKAAQYGSALPVHRWIRKLAREGLSPLLAVLRVCESQEECNKVERELIAAYRARLGMKLYNVTDGGEGGPLGEDWKAACRRGNARPEVKAKRAASTTAGWADPDVRQRRVDGMRAAHARPDIKEKMKASQRRTWAEKWSDPEKRATRLAKAHTPESRKARSIKKTIRNADPVVLANLSAKSAAFWGTPEGRARAKARAIEANARPEVKARIAETSRERWADPAYKARVAAAISAGARKPPQHGTYSEYSNHRCRCRPCKDAAAQRSRDSRARVRGGL